VILKMVFLDQGCMLWQLYKWYCCSWKWSTELQGAKPVLHKPRATPFVSPYIFATTIALFYVTLV